jgi:hypothetical protein
MDSSDRRLRLGGLALHISRPEVTRNFGSNRSESLFGVRYGASLARMEMEQLSQGSKTTVV